MSQAGHISPLAQRLQDMRDMRAYWQRNCDRPTEGYGPTDPADMLAVSERACAQVAAQIINTGEQPT